MATAATTSIQIRPMAIGIGAEIHGVDLRDPLEPSVVAEIRAALLRWKVIFFRDQAITPDDHLRFGRYFGTPSAHPTLPSLEGHPEILLLASRPDTARPSAILEARWHTDVTFSPTPPMASILVARDTPTFGGDTQWSNLARAYDRLSEPIRNLIDGLSAVHRNSLQLERVGDGLGNDLVSTFTSRPLAALHPVVAVHPETGERVLVVNPTFTSHIVELSARESAHLLAMLYEHISRPEFTVRLRWEPGTIAFWDNRSTAHLAPQELPFLSPDERAAVGGRPRVMHRVTLDGQPLVGPTGLTSRQLDGAAFG